MGMQAGPGPICAKCHDDVWWLSSRDWCKRCEDEVKAIDQLRANFVRMAPTTYPEQAELTGSVLLPIAVRYARSFAAQQLREAAGHAVMDARARHVLLARACDLVCDNCGGDPDTCDCDES